MNSHKIAVAVLVVVGLGISFFSGKTSHAETPRKSCGEDPTLPKGTFEITTRGLEKILKAGLELAEMRADSLALKLTEREIPPIRPSNLQACLKSRKNALQRPANVGDSYKYCQGPPQGMTDSNSSRSDLTMSLLSDPTEYKIDHLALRDFQLNPAEIRCEKLECTIDVSVKSIGIGADFDAKSLATGKEWGFKNLRMGMSPHGDSKNSGVLSLKLKAKFRPDGQLTDAIQVDTQATGINIDWSTIQFPMPEMSAEDRERWTRITLDRSLDPNDVPSNFKNRESVLMYNMVNSLDQLFRNPGLEKKLRESISNFVVNRLNTEVKTRVRSVPLLYSPISTRLRILGLDDAFKAHKVKLASQALGVRAEAFRDLISNDIAQDQQDPLKLTSPEGSKAVTEFLEVIRQDRSGLAAKQVEEQIEVWTQIQKSLEPSPSASHAGKQRQRKLPAHLAAEAKVINQLIERLKFERVRLSAYDREEMDLKITALYASALNESVMGILAVCPGCMKMDAQETGKPEKDPFTESKKSYDMAVNLSWDFINYLLEVSGQRRLTDFCINLEPTAATCENADPKDRKIILKFNQPLKLGWDGEKGMYVEIRDGYVDLPNIKVLGGLVNLGRLSPWQADGRIFMKTELCSENCLATNGNPLQGQVLQTRAWDLEAKFSPAQSDDDEVAWLFNRKWKTALGAKLENMWEDAVLKYLNQSIPVPEGAEVRYKTGPNGVQTYITAKPELIDGAKAKFSQKKLN